MTVQQLRDAITSRRTKNSEKCFQRSVESVTQRIETAETSGTNKVQ